MGCGPHLVRGRRTYAAVMYILSSIWTREATPFFYPLRRRPPSDGSFGCRMRECADYLLCPRRFLRAFRPVSTGRPSREPRKAGRIGPGPSRPALWSALICRKCHGCRKFSHRAHGNHDSCFVVRLRVGSWLAGNDHLADDGLFLAGVVVEDAVARLHLPQVLPRERIGDAVPDCGAVADQVVVAVAVRFVLQSQRAIGDLASQCVTSNAP